MSHTVSKMYQNILTLVSASYKKVHEFKYHDYVSSVNERLIWNPRAKRIVLNSKYRNSIHELRKFISNNYKNPQGNKNFLIVIIVPKRKDIDACVKPILDAMERNIYLNDSQVTSLLVFKHSEKYFHVIIFEENQNGEANLF
ncbi:MAG: RusA family crossover junction endodeoxyribonuclease, partial [Flavobacteriales bacterium]|nr:RusA family crossover junction endodeoxyribonuclease [Flavobacteriales bacterium]